MNFYEIRTSKLHPWRVYFGPLERHCLRADNNVWAMDCFVYAFVATRLEAILAPACPTNKLLALFLLSAT